MKSKYSGKVDSGTRSLTSLLLRLLRSLVGSGRSSDLISVGQGDADFNCSNTAESICKEDTDFNCSDNIQRIYKYDVFISFRGTDTRNNFTDHLYNHFIRKGIFVFKDDKMLETGQPISSQLLEAIKNSRVSIIVFSQDYAASTWCLEEMATIADCQRDFKQIVFPVFYDVDPSDVRKQNGVYENAFVLQNEKFKQDPGKVIRWKRAMTVLANFVGWDVRYKREFREIEKIVQAVIKTLGHKFSGFADDLIGIQPHVDELENLLKLNSEEDGFRVLGIWGMGGIGKTTHATVLYDRISYQFDASCFIEIVSQIYKDGGAIAVQKQILHQTLHEKNLETYSLSEISGIIRNRLHNIKVLVVLDNVDQLEQLKKLAITPNFLCAGSRVVITSRDNHILKVYGADAIHEIPLLSCNDAHKLFLRKAFKSGDPISGFRELIPKVLAYTQHLPLAIRVMGSFLCTRDSFEWRDVLDRLRNNPDKEIMNVFRMSFDGIHQEEKEIFLHIACFFKGEREDYVKQILDACRLHPCIGISVIIEKSLISIKNDEIHMHEMLQELGKNIVREDSQGELGCQSRLWLYEDFHHVINSKTGTNNVKAIVLDQKVDVSEYNGLRSEGLSEMRGLELLILYQRNFLGSIRFLSDSLRCLLWHGCPFSSFPSSFSPSKLVQLNLSDSNVNLLWEGIKDLPCLRRLDLSNSIYLEETPNFEGIPNLELLDLTRCTKLTQVHPSIRNLEKLAFLSLRNCTNLVILYPGSAFNHLSSLRVLYLSGCINLQDIVLDFRWVQNLEYLDLEGCKSLPMIHESIGALIELRFLSLRNCTNLTKIPDSLHNIRSLVTIDLCNCFNLRYLPLKYVPSSYLESLIYLDVSFCCLFEVPNAIGELRCLERLNLQGNLFRSLPDTMSALLSLAYLNLSHCPVLQILPLLPSTNASSQPVGRYFETVSGSCNHRSGLYIFNCPNLVESSELSRLALAWLTRLVEEPRHFRCGFDIIIPGSVVPKCFKHQFSGGSIIRIVDSDVNDNWIGFAFCVAFEITQSFVDSILPHPLYLSFESEDVEESFDMPLSFDKKINFGSNYLWLIYISRPHCHFVQTRVRITFKASPSLEIKKWGLHMMFKQDINAIKRVFNYEEELVSEYIKEMLVDLNIEEESLTRSQITSENNQADYLHFDYVQETDTKSLYPKIRLPYNWLVTEEEEIENIKAKGKENNLSLIGTGLPQLEDMPSSSQTK